MKPYVCICMPRKPSWSTNLRLITRPTYFDIHARDRGFEVAYLLMYVNFSGETAYFYRIRLRGISR
jgi:hypothetical protein